MNLNVDTIRTMVQAQLSAEAYPERERIKSLVETLRPLAPDMTDEEAEALAAHFEEVHGFTMKAGISLEERGFEPWLAEAKAHMDDYYWQRYRSLLGNKGFSGQVLAGLDEVTDRVLGLLENPAKNGPWDRRGMVVGHVQSGKTANYTGLVCKAADAGYRVIVVIAGIHNNLRNQTQKRIDEGLIGFDSSRLLTARASEEKVVGVGRIDSTRRPSSFTNAARDFDKKMATGVGQPLRNLSEPAVFVIKKNSSTLRNLLEWLAEQNSIRRENSISEPMLLIDDEADNASINIKRGKDEVSRINGQIRQLLKLFDRSCYVGYTATPFANIFIDPDSADDMYDEDLFPRDFIVSLDPPTNYFGASRVFEEESDGIVRTIEDNEELLPLKHRIDFRVTALPESLKEAIRTFVLVRAIRITRGAGTAHNSMLVNASRFTVVQKQLRDELHLELESLRSAIRVAGIDDTGAEDPLVSAMRETFNREFHDCGCSWEQVHNVLREAIDPVRAVEVNSRSSSGSGLNYDEHASTGLHVIAVGGFSLSRGLTLEGLSVSYFLRNSMMYDTLMQMGRWFGYRPGYDDLCRIWMLEEAQGWYAHISESIEELRSELRAMASSSGTPREFGLKVRSHPDTLIVTARNKMGSGQELVVDIGLGNRFVETTTLRRDENSLAANRDAAQRFASELLERHLPRRRHKKNSELFQRVPVELVLDFIAGFLNHPGSMLTETDPIRRYIEERQDSELAEWDVLFPGIGLDNADYDDAFIDESLGFPLVFQRRLDGSRGDPTALVVSRKQRIASRPVEDIGLTEEQKTRAQHLFETEEPDKVARAEEEGRPVNYPDRAYRAVRPRPLLIVHLLAIGNKDERPAMRGPVIAWSISFPPTDREERKVSYNVNAVWFAERYGEEADEEEAAGDE